MSDEEQPKIIVDEGWKAKVQREKEEAEKKAETEPVAEAVPESEAVPEVKEGEQPESTLFMSLVSDIATQTMFALGLIAPEGQERVMVDLNQAKYLVDTLVMLRKKTDGHLEPAEKGHLTEALSELQRIFAMRAQQVQEASLKQAGVDIHNLKGEPPKA